MVVLFEINTRYLFTFINIKNPNNTGNYLNKNCIVGYSTNIFILTDPTLYNYKIYENNYQYFHKTTLSCI